MVVSPVASRLGSRMNRFQKLAALPTLAWHGYYLYVHCYQDCLHRARFDVWSIQLWHASSVLHVPVLLPLGWY